MKVLILCKFPSIHLDDDYVSYASRLNGYSLSHLQEKTTSEESSIPLYWKFGAKPDF